MDALPMDQKIEKIEPWSAKGSKKFPGRNPGDGPVARGSRHSLLRIKRRPTSTWSHTPKGRRPSEFLRCPGFWIPESANISTVDSRKVFQISPGRYHTKRKTQHVSFVQQERANWWARFRSIKWRNRWPYPSVNYDPFK